jgi:hypothetical protein
MPETINDMGPADQVPDLCGLCKKTVDPLFIKPQHFKVNHRRYYIFRERPLWICIDCLNAAIAEVRDLP